MVTVADVVALGVVVDEEVGPQPTNNELTIISENNNALSFME